MVCTAWARSLPSFTSFGSGENTPPLPSPAGKIGRSPVNDRLITSGTVSHSVRRNCVSVRRGVKGEMKGDADLLPTIGDVQEFTACCSAVQKRSENLGGRLRQR